MSTFIAVIPKYILMDAKKKKRIIFYKINIGHQKTEESNVSDETTYRVNYCWLEKT